MTSNPMNRRAALGFLARSTAQASALAVVPAAAFGSPVHPDAALFAMQSAIEAADKEFNAALDALEVADDAYDDKEPDRPAEREPEFLPEELQAFDLLGTAAALRKIRGPSPALAAYEQAVAAHEREVERLKAECGVTAAHEMEEAAHEANRQVLSDLIDTPAKTLAGLIFKARFAEKRDYDKEVMVSIVDDLLAMAKDDPEGLADV